MKRPIKSTIMVFVQDIITGDKMGHYKHLSTIEREIILCGITKGLSISKISNVLGRNKSTISRELKRNTCMESYSPSKAKIRPVKARFAQGLDSLVFRGCINP